MSDTHFPPPSDPPPWIVSAPPPPPGVRPARPGGRAPLVLLGAALAVLLALGAGGAWWLLRSGGPDAAPAAATPPPDGADSGGTSTDVGGDGAGGTVVPTDAGPADDGPAPGPATDDGVVPDPVGPAADPEADALDRLDDLAGQDLARVVLDGRYVAQLASKYPGIRDPLQTAADGSHTFAATDVLREHEMLRTDPANGAARVVLLRSDTFGKRQTVGGAPLYVTFAVGDFPGAADVEDWCAARFPDLSTEDRLNRCAVRRLRPPA